MANKALFWSFFVIFCAFLGLKIAFLSRLQIKLCPKGLHNFAFCILIFAFFFQFLALDPWPLAPNVIVRKYLRVDMLLYICRETITNVMSALQINLFLQNEPNFRKSQVNLNNLLKRNYEQMDTWSIRKNEPKTNPNEPKTNPILANKTPIRTQFKPNLSCRSLWRSRNKNNSHPDPCRFGRVVVNLESEKGPYYAKNNSIPLYRIAHS